MTWRLGAKKLASVMAPVGASRPRGLGPVDEDCCRLESLRDTAGNRKSVA